MCELCTYLTLCTIKAQELQVVDSIGVVTEGTTLLTIELSGLERITKYKYPHASLAIVKSYVTVGHFRWQYFTLCTCCGLVLSLST